ncbi:MAG: hypothetical protein K6G26_05180, partial [Lachnospiraceae bacterium]|nr:hypothetical protein [Lachnospiraceae bacterium]
TVIVKFSTYMWYEPYVLFRDFLHKKSILYFRKRWINHICTVACVVIIHYVLKLPFFSTISWPMLVVKAAVSVCIVTVVYFIRYVGTEEFAFVKSRLKWFKK